MTRAAWAGLILAACVAGPVMAADQRIKFDPGHYGTTVSDSVKGDELDRFLIGASAGQKMVIDLRSPNLSANFNIYAPGTTPGEDMALFRGMVEGMHYEGILPESGDYAIEVFLVRAAARRGESADYAMDIRIEVTDAAAAEPARAFDAAGQIPCAAERSAPTSACDFTVTRGGDTSTVVVQLPGGGQRVIEFTGAMAVSSDRPDKAPVRSERRGDLNLIAIGDDERYEIPDAVMLGG